MNLGHRNRAVGSTAMNDRSSRSHSYLNVHVQARDLASGSEFHGCMNLVDLAGSERADKDSSDVKELKEQIAKLKAALAKKESENLQQSKLVRMMSVGASISGSNTSSEEDGNSKENTSVWPSPVGSPQLKVKPDSGKWVDKIMLNKPNPRKIYPEQPDKLVLSRSISSSEYEINVNRYDVATTTDESDIEAAASDNSEPDFSKINTVAVLGSKIRSPGPRQARTTQIRTPILPQPSTRRQSNGARAGIPGPSGKLLIRGKNKVVGSKNS